MALMHNGFTRFSLKIVCYFFQTLALGLQLMLTPCKMVQFMQCPGMLAFSTRMLRPLLHSGRLGCPVLTNALAYYTKFYNIVHCTHLVTHELINLFSTSETQHLTSRFWCQVIYPTSHFVNLPFHLPRKKDDIKHCGFVMYRFRSKPARMLKLM